MDFFAGLQPFRHIFDGTHISEQFSFTFDAVGRNFELQDRAITA